MERSSEAPSPSNNKFESLLSKVVDHEATRKKLLLQAFKILF